MRQTVRVRSRFLPVGQLLPTLGVLLRFEVLLVAGDDAGGDVRQYRQQDEGEDGEKVGDEREGVEPQGFPSRNSNTKKKRIPSGATLTSVS
jgi:hypothetical protein